MENDGFKDLMATDKQRRAYFSLMKTLGYTSADAKHILKRKYNLDSFAEMDKERMSYVIDRLITRKEKRDDRS